MHMNEKIMLEFKSADLQRHAGMVQDRALVEPVAITRNGRARLVLMSVQEYERLKQRDREAVRAEDLDEADVARIAASEPPEGAAAFDSELSDEPS